MQILIIRHGPAGDAAAFAKISSDDARRPLTTAGEKKMKKAGAGLRRVVPAINVLATSPLVRAVQTARIVAEAYDGLPVHELADLSPGRPLPPLLRWLKNRPADDLVALVGHEPHLSTLASWLLTGQQERSIIDLKKGSMLLLDLPRPSPGSAKLLWHLKPGHLRKLRG